MSSEWPRDHVIGLLGGTGPQGRGLAYRFAAAGAAVLIGSRQAERAAEVAGTVGEGVRGADNATCAQDADVVVVTVPWSGHAELLAGLGPQLAGKVVVDTVNPLGFDSRGPFVLPVEEGSATEQAQVLLAESRVVGAFHHVSHVLLADRELAKVSGDVLVVGDDRPAVDLVITLADLVPGMRGLYAGRLRNAGQLEGLAANLIAVNRRYRAHAGIRLTDV